MFYFDRLKKEIEMKYRFENRNDGSRLMVSELDSELDYIGCTDEELDCLSEYYRDLTVTFDIDLYCRLHRMLLAAGESRKMVKVYMDASIRSISGSFEYALMGCCLEICFYGALDIAAHWFWRNTNIDFNVELDFPSDFYVNPAAWFEKEIAAKGIQNVEEVMEAEQWK